MTKTTDIELKTDNMYCPHCGAIQKKTENFCSHCSAGLHKDKKEENGNSREAKKANSPFYKNKIFIALFGLFVLSFSIVGVILYSKFSEGKRFRNKVIAVWQDNLKETEALNKEVATMEQVEDFKKVGIKIKGLENLLETGQEELGKLKTPDTYKDGKETFLLGLSDYKEYLEALRSASDNPSKMTNQDIEEIETLGETSRITFSKTLNKLDFLGTSVPDETYSIVIKFQEVRSSYEEKLATEEQSQAEKARKEKQEQEDKSKAEAIVNSFMNFYIAGNEGQLKKYMTTAFQKEFNYADLSSDARMYSYPESFRITVTKKTSDTQFSIYGRELQVNRDSGSKWTINRHFAVIWVQSENKWSIDRWDIATE